MFTPHNSCRACGFGPPANTHYCKLGSSKDKLVSILDLGPMPLANSFSRGLAPRPGYYPLHLLACPRCGLGQLSVTVDPATLYSNYLYVTSTSQTLDDHILLLHDWLKHLNDFKTVMEVGSNDGRVLKKLRSLGASFVVGVDPATNLAGAANSDGVQTVNRMFDDEAADHVARIMTPALPDLILARHVFCHCEDWRGFLKSALRIANPSTMLCIEAPWAHDTIEKVEWDQIYHEHLSYITLKSVQHLVEGSGWSVYAVRRFGIHGGVLAIVLVPDAAKTNPLPCVQDYLAQERCGIPDWQIFADKAEKQQQDMRALIEGIVGCGKKIVGYGATAKATTWANVLKLDSSKVYGFYDCTPSKHYTTVPGTDIQVIPEGGFYVDNPDYAIVWAWNFAEEIIRKNAKWHSDGGRFIVPVPTPRILV